MVWCLGQRLPGLVKTLYLAETGVGGMEMCDVTCLHHLPNIECALLP